VTPAGAGAGRRPVVGPGFGPAADAPFRDPTRVPIPSGVRTGFTGAGAEPSIVAPCAPEPRGPADAARLGPPRNPIPSDGRPRQR
jgi:hypothetical protein